MHSVAWRTAALAVPGALAVTAKVAVVLGRTRFGRHIHALGGNAEGARRAGIDVDVDAQASPGRA